MLNIKGIINRYEIIRIPVYRLAMRYLVKPYVTFLKVPIIATTGTNGKTTVTRLLSKIYTDAGYNVGACTTEGVLHCGKIVSDGDRSGGGGVWKAAKCPNVDLLVLEIARKAIINYDLGFKNCQVGIVTNVFEDHLGFDGIDTLEQMAQLKSTIPKYVDFRGKVILNGDNTLARKMSIHSRAKAIYFVVKNDYRKFKNVYFLREMHIWRKNGNKEKKVVNVHKIPITLNGISEYNVANVMAVLAAVESMQKYIPINNNDIKQSLYSFGTNPYDNIGRFTQITYKNEKMIFSFAKNPESNYQEIQIIKKIKDKIKHNKVVGILSAVGNRNEKYFNEISKLVAPVCDNFFLIPPKAKYLRGRSGDEIVSLLSTHIAKERIIDIKKPSLENIFSKSNARLGHKNLYIVFNPVAYEFINLYDILAEGNMEFWI